MIIWGVWVKSNRVPTCLLVTQCLYLFGLNILTLEISVKWSKIRKILHGLCLKFILQVENRRTEIWARNNFILSMVLFLQQFFNFIRSILIRFVYFKKFLKFQSQSWNICFLLKRRKLSIDGLKLCLSCDFIRDLSPLSWRWWSGVDSHLSKF